MAEKGQKGRGSKRGCQSSFHLQFKDKAKTRVDDLQGMFTDLHSALKESRSGDVAVLEEQVNQMLREWKAELNEASPASSLLENNHADLSSEIHRLLHLSPEGQDDAMLQLSREEQDDATSKLDDMPLLKPEPLEAAERLEAAELLGVPGPGATAAVYQEQDYYLGQDLTEHVGTLAAPQYQNNIYEETHNTVNCTEGTTHLDYQQFDFHQEIDPDQFLNFEGNGLPHISDFLPSICPPASAFLRPKCALWDCPRPAQGSEWCQEYCSSFHGTLAFNEGPPGMAPVLRPGGINLKDGPLFAALGAKSQGKNVGIPECEGAATTKSPWNAPDLFDLSVLEGETVREWLFFDKPRRAFESGSRKQRSLPDYKGRGWHESRKQVMKEFGGLKRSYYMDPQPSDYLEWHIFEYELDNCDVCALYRLELKLVCSKKASKTKVASDPLVDLQQQMGRLNAENSMDIKRNVKGRAKANKDSPETMILYHAPNQTGAVNKNDAYGPSLPYVHKVESFNEYYGN